MAQAASTVHKSFRLATLGFFAAAITLPLVGSVLRWGVTTDQDVNTLEQRPITPFPEINRQLESIRKFPSGFQAFYNDRFGFRKPLIQAYGAVQYFGFGASSSPNVTVGKAGWLYYAEPSTVQYYRSITPFTQQQLVQWQRGLEQRQNWLAAQGITYLFVIVPNKDTVYPEFVPSWLNRVHPQSRLDQLLQHLQANSKVNILDLRQAMLPAKSQRQLYYLTDTHWNPYGAFLSYQAIIQRLSAQFPQLQPIPLTGIEMYLSPPLSGDLAKLSALGDRLTEQTQVLVPPTPLQAQKADPKTTLPQSPPTQQPFATQVANPKLPRAVIFHDSFFIEGMKSWFPEHFQRAVFIWRDDFDPQIIRQERPHLVVQQLAERKLMIDSLPDNPPEVR
jgi:alginate O-acetyltransferase complex protein AlgJ